MRKQTCSLAPPGERVRVRGHNKSIFVLTIPVVPGSQLDVGSSMLNVHQFLKKEACVEQFEL
jgi:hypothetical protein